MLFYFDIGQKDLAKINPDLLAERVSMLMRSHRGGRHFVVMSRNSSAWIIAQNLSMGANDITTLRVIQDEVTQYGRLHENSEYFVSISSPGTAFQRHGATQIRLPLDNEFFEQILMKPVLVVEDIENDLKVLNFIFKNIPGNLCWRQFCFEPLHAGGSRADVVSTRSIEQSRIVFTILDSDKKSPYCSSNAYAKLKNVFDQSHWPLFFFDVLPCSELENIFTIRVLENLNSKDAHPCLDHLRRIHAIENSSNIKLNEYYQYYFDMKHGLPAATAVRLTDQIVIAWLEEKLLKVNLKLDTVNVPGLGEGLVNQVFSSHAAQQEFHQVIRSPEWLAVFGDIIRKIMWTFAAAKPKIA
jgi:hypothetical protein